MFCKLIDTNIRDEEEMLMLITQGRPGKRVGRRGAGREGTAH